MSKEPTRDFLQDGFERVQSSLDLIEARLTSLEDKIDQWLDLEGGLLAKNVIERLRGPGPVGQANGLT